jgi:hypothetical protein
MKRTIVAAATGGARATGAKPVRGDLDRLAWLLDSSIRLPGGYRIGLDGLIGLIPGFGDAAGALIGMYIVARASRFDLPRAVLARMVLNVGLESVIGAIPIFGDLFDFAFKSNLRNVALLRRYASEPRRETRVSWALLGGATLFLVLLAIVVIAVGVALAQWLASLL